MDDRDFQPQTESGEQSRAKIFWMHAGLILLSIALAVVTVVVISLNR